MIKIGFDAKRIFRNLSGLGNYSRSTVELLAKYHPENEYSLFTAFDENKVEFAIPKGFKVVNPTGIIADVVPSVWRSCNMAHDIRRSRIDIFHGLSNELPFDIRVGGAKSVVTMHDLIFLRYPNLYGKLDRMLYEFKYRKSCNNADMIIAISNQTKNDLIDFWNIQPERIQVIYQGCNSLYYEKASTEVKERVKERYNLPDQYILSVGTIEERKNLMLTLHAIGEGNIDMPLVACGRWTPYVEKLQEYVAHKGLENKVHFIHDCSLEELPAIYQMATVSVYVSLFEGFGIPILESMNCGTPVITSRGGVFNETGGKAALYVGQYDLEDMIELLKRVISDSAWREELIQNGYKHAANFTDDKIADNLMALYEKMM
ncbi:MAG: glycosyltransferase family 1 protein [Rikenellaceae bacterium]